MTKRASDELSVALMKKHLTLYNKMVRASTYKGVAKLKAEQVREIFKRDFRKTESGKDGKTFYPPRSYDVELDSGDDFTDAIKALSKDLPINKPKKTEPKPKPVKKEPTASAKKIKVKKEEPKPKPAPKKDELKPAPKKDERKKIKVGKEKPAFKKLREEIDELKQIIKKQYEKNKEKLSKMNAKKYNGTIEKKLDNFIEDAEEIYNDYNFGMSKANVVDLEKYFFSVVPRKQQKKK